MTRFDWTCATIILFGILLYATGSILEVRRKDAEDRVKQVQTRTVEQRLQALEARCPKGEQ